MGIVPINRSLSGLSADFYKIEWSFEEGERFTGSAVVGLQSSSSRNTLALNCDSLAVTEVVVLQADGLIAVRHFRAERGLLELDLSSDLKFGRFEVRLKWAGTLSKTPDGLYSIGSGSERLIATQFQPAMASSAFPCLDTPRSRAVFEISIRCAAGLKVVSNTETRAIDREDDFEVHRFVRTPPIPCHLLAFFLGPFEMITGENNSTPFPIRLFRSSESQWSPWPSIQAAAAACTFIEEQLQAPFLWSKLDLVVLPELSSVATEYPGCPVFREAVLSGLAQDSNEQRAAESLRVVVHEVAHHWFGGMVTPESWKDLWVSEGVTMFLEELFFEARNDSRMTPDYLEMRNSVMESSRLPSDRSVCGDIDDPDAPILFFDGSSYIKGAEILRRLAQNFGTKTLVRALGQLAQAQVFASLSTQFFLEELERLLPVRSIHQLVDPYLEAPGIPIVQVEAVAAHSLRSLRVAVQTNLNEGAIAWPQSSMRVLLADGTSVERSLALKHATFEISFPQVVKWYYPNADESSWLLWVTDEGNLTHLCGYASVLSERERRSLPWHVWRHFEDQHITAARFVACIHKLAQSEDPVVLGHLVDLLERFSQLVPNHLCKVYAEFERDILRPRLNSWGFDVKPSEVPGVRRARSKVAARLARLGDVETIGKLCELAEYWVSDNQYRPPSELERIALETRSSQGGEAWFSSLAIALRACSSPLHREAVLAALGSFPDPEILNRVWKWILEGEIFAQDTWFLLSPARKTPELSLHLLRWVDNHRRKLEGVLGSEVVWLPWNFVTLGVICEPGLISEVFLRSSWRTPGLKSQVVRVLESVRNIRRIRANLPQDAFRGLADSAGDWKVI